MKTIPLLLLSLALLSTAHAAEDIPPPPPPNPFSNLPPGENNSFAPFDEDFDEGASGGGPANTPFPGRPGMPRPGGGDAPPRGGSNIPAQALGSGGSPSTPRPGATKYIPTNAKDMVENFDYPDAEILDVAKAIAKLTGKNFIYNPQDIKGRISVVSQTPITVGDAWAAFLTALNLKGFALVPSGKYLRIERIANAKEKQTPIYSGKLTPNNDEFITRVIPLRYIDATEFETAFRLWMPREARMQAYGQTNTIIITDTAAHINRMVELINLLDVAGYQESLVVVPIRNASAKDIAKLVEQILNERSTGSSVGGFGVPPRPQTYGAPATTGRRGRSGGSTISKIIADDRTNSLIVKANAAGIIEIRTLVRRLDTKIAANEGGGRIHVISLRFANAEDLAKTLQTLTGGAGSASRAPRPFPTFGEQTVFQSDIKVAADKTTQSLVVTASPQDFATLKKVVERLDVPRDQVFIEAMILEMGLNRDNSFGTSFASAANGVSLNSASKSLEGMLAGNPVAAGFVLGFKHGPAKADITVPGASGNTTYHVNSLNGLIELIQGNTDSNVIATPQIIALDNEKATFEVSEVVPVEKTTVSNGTPVQSFESDTARLLLEVTPQINKGSNFVKLDINQRLENFDPTNVPTKLQGQAFGKNIRATQTKLFVESDDTVVLSGMIRDSVIEVTKKIPILGDIPVLGWLFKNRDSKVRKTNLLVFITPRVIKQYDKIRGVLNRKLSEREEFVRENFGSADPFARTLGRLKKELPDLTVIEPLPQTQPQESSSFSGPSGPDREDAEDIYDQPNFFYPPEGGGVPLPPVDVPGGPQIDNPPLFDNGGAPPPMATPQDPSFTQ